MVGSQVQILTKILITVVLKFFVSWRMFKTIFNSIYDHVSVIRNNITFREVKAPPGSECLNIGYLFKS